MARVPSSIHHVHPSSQTAASPVIHANLGNADNENPSCHGVTDRRLKTLDCNTLALLQKIPRVPSFWFTQDLLDHREKIAVPNMPRRDMPKIYPISAVRDEDTTADGGLQSPIENVRHRDLSLLRSRLVGPNQGVPPTEYIRTSSMWIARLVSN